MLMLFLLLILCLTLVAGQNASLADTVASLALLVEDNQKRVEASANTAWLVLNGITILGMQFGFALLEAGCTAVRRMPRFGVGW